MLAFASLGCVPVERLAEVFEYLIGQVPLWRGANQKLLDRGRGYTTAIALLAKVCFCKLGEQEVTASTRPPVQGPSDAFRAA